eukprot:PhF_6_TR17045/c3_g1_i3/m.25958/K10392/KIF1; kinesin family member 1
MSTNRVTVAVRVRPLSAQEMANVSPVSPTGPSIVRMSGTTTMVADPEGKTKGNSFTFDHSLWSATPEDPSFVNQSKVFDILGVPLVKSALDGFHTCLLAYGQTGSGKTYSVIGYQQNSEERGIMPRVADALFAQANARVSDSWTYKMELSYYEIYCEKCRCLLNPSAVDLKVREHPVTGPFLENLTKMIVKTPGEVLKLMQDGNRTRTVASTAMNATSSRSHAIFTITLSQRRKINDVTWSDIVSHITLVDLAGSERAGKSGLDGKTLQEGTNINRSLTTLGKVISALAMESSGSGEGSLGKHVPYRESALTWLLKDTFGGNSKTTMLATISPAAYNYEETVSTLRYADNAKKIVTRAVVNEDPQVKKIRELQEEIEKLRAQLKKQSLTTQAVGQASEAALTTENYEAMSFVKRLEVTQRMLIDAQTENELSWDEQEHRNVMINEERERAMRDIGVVPSTSTSAGLTSASVSNAVATQQPVACLVNLNEDAFLAGCLVYNLDSTTGAPIVVGAVVPNPDRDIVLTGPDIHSPHAVFHWKGGLSWAICAADEASLVYVNGVCISKGCVERKLESGDRVIFGATHVFRFKGDVAATTNATTTTGGSGKGGGPILNATSEWEKALLERHEAEKATIMSEHTRQVDRLTKIINEIHSQQQLAVDAAQTSAVAQAQKRAQMASVGRQPPKVMHRWRLLLIG